MAVAELTHGMLGRVMVNVRHNSHHISARWKQGVVSVNIPQGTPLSLLQKVLDDFTPRLLSTRPEVSYYEGQHFCFPYVDVTIRRQHFIPEKIICTPSLPTLAVEVGANWDFDLETTSRAISDMLCKAARRVAADALLPRARYLATKVGRAPIGWTISSGHRVLGRCSNRGIIALSYILVFLPQHLSDYVILHELAHLSEMNHSENFHALLNFYLDGKESQLVSELRAYRWPVLRR